MGTVWEGRRGDRVRYDLLKSALQGLPDKVMVGLIRYGTKHLVGWNVVRFVTTKRESYAPEQEVRAMLCEVDPIYWTA